MAIVFYKHGADAKIDAYYADYTGGTSWNEDDPRYPAPTKIFVSSLNFARTEDGLKDILTCKASQSVLMGQKIKKQGGGTLEAEAVSLLNVVTSDELTVYVLKGVHQEKEPHITLAMGGQMFHVNVTSGRLGQANLFKVTSISVGNQVKNDPDGWTVVT